MKKFRFLSLTLGIAFLFQGLSGVAVADDQHFLDVPEDHLFHTEIQYFKDQGIVSGYGGEGLYYGPEDEITFSAFIKMAMEASNYEFDVTDCLDRLSQYREINWYDKYFCPFRDRHYYTWTLVSLNVPFKDRSYNLEPEGPLSVLEAIVLIARIFELDSDEEYDQNWYQRYFIAMEKASALPVEIESLDQKMTREMAAAMLYSLASGDVSRGSTTYENLMSITEPLYFYKKGTNVPITNTFIEVVKPYYCVNSGECRLSELVYEGYTNNEGAIQVPKGYVGGINDLPNCSLHFHDFSVQMKRFVRIGNCYNVFAERAPDSNIVFMTPAKDPTEPIELVRGEEFFLEGNRARKNTFRLGNVDLENNTVELTQLVGTRGENYGYFPHKALNTFQLKKGEPAYIPGEVTDSTFTLESLSEEKVVLSYNSVITTETWSTRESLDFSKYLPDNDEEEHTYQEVLDFILSKNDQLKPYLFDTYLYIYAAAPTGVNNECFYVRVGKRKRSIENPWYYETTTKPCGSKDIDDEVYFE